MLQKTEVIVSRDSFLSLRPRRDFLDPDGHVPHRGTLVLPAAELPDATVARNKEYADLTTGEAELDISVTAERWRGDLLPRRTGLPATQKACCCG